MNKYLPFFACGIAGIALGYGLTATVTHAQLAKAADSAQTLQMTPVSAPAQNFNTGGGSCG